MNSLATREFDFVRMQLFVGAFCFKERTVLSDASCCVRYDAVYVLAHAIRALNDQGGDATNGPALMVHRLG